MSIRKKTGSLSYAPRILGQLTRYITSFYYLSLLILISLANIFGLFIPVVLSVFSNVVVVFRVFYSMVSHVVPFIMNEKPFYFLKYLKPYNYCANYLYWIGSLEIIGQQTNHYYWIRFVTLNEIIACRRLTSALNIPTWIDLPYN